MFNLWSVLNLSCIHWQCKRFIHPSLTKSLHDSFLSYPNLILTGTFLSYPIPGQSLNKWGWAKVAIRVFMNVVCSFLTTEHRITEHRITFFTATSTLRNFVLKTTILHVLLLFFLHEYFDEDNVTILVQIHVS